MRKPAWMTSLLVVALLFSGIVFLGAQEETREFSRSTREIQRLSQSEMTEHLRDLRLQIEGLAQTSAEEFSYVNIIPFVSQANNTRTNLGLNNFSENSIVRGSNPNANVLIALFDPQGNSVGQGRFAVRFNELRQIDNIISALGANIGTGWLLIFSDEPLTAWASVIFNSTNDPSIELAIADQIFKPSAFVESSGTRLLIQSSAKVGFFQSSLVVVNIGSEDGNLSVKIYDQLGNLINTKAALIRKNGMFIDNDIRSAVSGTFGQIVIEVTDPTPPPMNNTAPRIVANSIVRSTSDTGGFFPAFALPQVNTLSIAGKWEGSLTGSLINAPVRIQLFQERDMLYGTLDVVGGSFPTVDRNFLISGEVIRNRYLLQIQDAFDADSPRFTFFSLRLFGNTLTGTSMDGGMIYFDEQNRRDVGRFSVTRAGHIY